MHTEVQGSRADDRLVAGHKATTVWPLEGGVYYSMQIVGQATSEVFCTTATTNISRTRKEDSITLLLTQTQIQNNHNVHTNIIVVILSTSPVKYFLFS